MSECPCIERMDAKLAEHNMALLTNLIGPARAFISTYRLDPKRRGKLPILQATYCPFCGVKYWPERIGSEAAE